MEETLTKTQAVACTNPGGSPATATAVVLHTELQTCPVR